MRIEPETRAEIARRRLAEIAASFDAQVPLPDHGRHVAAPPHRLGPWHVRFVAVFAVAGSVLIAWWLLASRPAVSDSLAFGAAAASASGSASPAATGKLVIDVAGKVRRPGIVTLPAGSRVHDAIAAAGGVEPRVDTSGLNLARKLTDGEQILVGVSAVGGVSEPGTGAPGSGAMNLNTATPEQLEELPGIGPVTAAAIVHWRTENGPFKRVEDLLEVTGIGEKTLEQLRSHVQV